jgi:bifunctional UDP-N-acetylglucosamine pyrophosphorylase/glucosamine-1-phosphate N-acetyltransferase
MINSNRIDVIVLAAGKGSRMKSRTPKVLHKIYGKTMINLVLDTSSKISTNPIKIVLGYKADLIKKEINTKFKVQYILQQKQLGTGHASQLALKECQSEYTLILIGDCPLIQKKSISPVFKLNSDISLISTNIINPHGYGRVINNNGFVEIIEEKNASSIQKKITEVNTGIIFGKTKILKSLVDKIKTDKISNEKYLTSIFKLSKDLKIKTGCFRSKDSSSFFGVNTTSDLKEAAKIYKQRMLDRLLSKGAVLHSSENTHIFGELTCGHNVELYPNVSFFGKVKIGSNVKIMPNCVIEESSIGDNTIILPNTCINGSKIEKNCTLGPSARIRPQSIISNNSRIGNFVEIKSSFIGKNSKVNHLSYIGDAKIGQNVNIGASTITCNYDGRKKHKTVIGNNVFVGSGVQLIAPIKIGHNSKIGAGSTLNIDVAKNKLAIARTKKVFIKDII